MNNSILQVMSESHEKLNKAFERLVDCKSGEYLLVKEAYDRFVEDTKNHFTTEEQSIFAFFYPKDKKKFDVIPEIVSQHVEMLKMLNVLGARLYDIEDYDFEPFKKLFEDHTKLEESRLYAEMDNSFTDDEKRFVLEKIRKE